MVKMIAGLGNPGEKYKETRHNAGFMVIDELARRHHVEFKEEKAFQALIGSYFTNGEKVVLVKPLTFMNLSGKAVVPLMTYFNIPVESMIVIHDDLDLPVGFIRFRQKGGSGGQNGLKSIIDHLNSKEFQRGKVGIGRPKGKMKVVDHVLGKFYGEEKTEMELSIQRMADAIDYFVDGNSFIDVMNQYN